MNKLKKRNVGFRVLIVLLILFPGLILPANAESAKRDVRESMVKIFVVQNRPDYTNPWNMFGSSSSSGSGCVISGNRILTNAHVISDQTYIQVRLFGHSKKYEAEVVAVSHEVDLALLTVRDSSFFKGVVPLEIGGLPQTQQDVVVYGFPQGGDTLSTTKGVVSRIEHQVYSHSLMGFLAVQIDAAINLGSSGGPVLIDDKVVGVAMQYIGTAENIGYMVPAPVIDHFLDDLKDGRYDGFPEDGIYCQSMENEGIRARYKMSRDQSGCLVYRVVPGSPAEGRISKGDVIMSIDGHRVASDGTVEFRPKERTNLNYYTQDHQVGDEMVVGVLRDGKKLEVRLKLDMPSGSNQLVPPEQFDVRPTYYIFGGLIFSPLTVNYLKTWGATWYNSAPKNLIARYYFDQLEQKGEEVVNLVRVLPAEVNRGYHESGDFRIIKVNDRKINNLKDLIRILEEDKNEPFVTFSDRWGSAIVLDRKKAEAEHEKILKRYKIPADRSDDLLKKKDATSERMSETAYKSEE
ncbi:MAG: trypsin-like peptidase domain-containing protein [Proteobacteria bacterium]|nr:trypsin-like peptidase domain-containing protein [Pseudomonadota bacterium]MBU1739825.1 trypsin-like peptidase domain-containing protein [Pseudomonadota bacterium]